VNRNTVALIPNCFDFCNCKAARLKKMSFLGQHLLLIFVIAKQHCCKKISFSGQHFLQTVELKAALFLKKSFPGQHCLQTVERNVLAKREK